MKHLIYAVIFLFMTGAVLPLHADTYERNIDFVDASTVNDYSYMLLEMKSGMSINTPRGDSGYPTTLMKAVQRQDLKMIRFCLKHRALINRANADGNTTLMSAVRTGNRDLVAFLISRGAGVNLADNLGNTALGIAAKQNDIDLVRLLLEKRARKGINDALVNAAGTPAPEIVKLLLKYGADPGAKARTGMTPVLAAVETGNIRTVMILLDNNKSLVNRPCTALEGMTPLRKAVAMGDVTMMKYLISRGARIQELNPAGATLLITAIQSNVPHAAIYLLDKGVSPVKSNKIGERPLELLCNHSIAGDVAILRTLVKKGADPNRKNRYKVTPLIMAASNGHLELAKALLEEGARINDTTVGGKSAVWYAARAGYTDVEKYLISRGGKPATIHERLRARPRPKKKMVADIETMFNAVRSNNISVISQVLNRGTKAIDRDWRGRTALEDAANSASTETVIYLLKKGAGADKESLNKAFVRSAGRDLRMTRVLLEEGADLYYLEGMALYNSVSYGQRDITRYLLDKKIIKGKTQKGIARAMSTATSHLAYSSLKQILESGAPVQGKDILTAAQSRKASYLPWRIIKLLCSHGADKNFTDSRGRTALDIAMINRNVRLVSYLEKYGFKKGQPPVKNKKCVASINYKLIDQLMQAAREENMRTIRALIRSGVSINSRDRQGQTILHITAAKGLWGNIPSYLTMGADRNIRDNNGKIARDIAVQKKNKAFIKTLDQWRPAGQRK